MKAHQWVIIAACMSALALSQAVNATPITGDPGADGWMAFGNSLSDGVYVKGDANYGYNTYSAGFMIETGSVLDISDGSLSWLAGDTVIGVGGEFQSIGAAAAGWSSFTGGAVNSKRSANTGPKLQAKFGTANATWTASSVAPGNGNGNSSSSNGGGRVQVRTSGYFDSGVWSTGSGTLHVPTDSHVLWDGPIDPAEQVARLIWNWDSTNNLVESWEILLNVSLLDRLTASDYAGLFPAIGDMAILTVQDGDNSYTDALVQIARVGTSTTSVPEPDSLFLFVACLIGLAVALRRRRHVQFAAHG